MKASIKTKLENLSERFEEIAALLSQPEVQSDQNQFRSLSQEYAQIDPIVNCYKHYQDNEDNLEAAVEMAKDSDPELREMAREEQKTETERNRALRTQGPKKEDSCDLFVASNAEEEI